MNLFYFPWHFSLLKYILSKLVTFWQLDDRFYSTLFNSLNFYLSLYRYSLYWFWCIPASRFIPGNIGTGNIGRCSIPDSGHGSARSLLAFGSGRRRQAPADPENGNCQRGNGGNNGTGEEARKWQHWRAPPLLHFHVDTSARVRCSDVWCWCHDSSKYRCK